MSGPCRRCRLALLLLAVALSSGCMPHVLHSPRVERGTTGVVAGSLGRNIDADDDSPTYVPSLYGGARWGYVAPGEQWAFSVGAQVPPVLLAFAWDETDSGDAVLDVALATSYLDLYTQPPGGRGRNWDAGVGALASTALFAPYVQLGRLDERGEGWYTTQGVGITGAPLFDDGLFWLSSLMWRDTGREGAGTAAHVGVSGGVGRDGREAVWWLGIAVTVEFGLPRAGR